MGQSSQFKISRTRLEGVEAVEADSNRAFARHTHDQFGIGVVVRGAQRSASGRGQVEAYAGAVITVNPGEVHDGVPFNDDGRTWSMLYFDEDVILDRLEDIADGRSIDELHFPVLTDKRAAGLFLKLCRAVTSQGSAATLEAESHLLELLGCLVAGPFAKTVTSAPSGVGRAKALIDDCPAEAFTLAELAGQASLSRFQFLRAFNRLTGLTPHAYMLQKRVHLARQMIRDGLPLAEIAAASGFADQSHMTRAFAVRYGITPGGFAAAFSDLQ